MAEQNLLASRPVDAALDLAAKGFPVFPCGQDKRPLVKWTKEATTDPQRVESMWRQHPYAMIGLPTGPKSGLYVIDLDVDKNTGEAVGEASLSALGMADLMAEGLSVCTPSGGRHIYFRHPGEGFGNSAKRLGNGIDTRGDGGYVIAPGSQFGTDSYRAVTGNLDKATLPALPQSVRDLLETPKKASEVLHLDVGNQSAWADAALSGELGKLMAAPEGRRNDTLNTVAFRLGQIVGSGRLDDSQVRCRLLGSAQAIGLPEQEAIATIESGLSAGMQHPREPSGGEGNMARAAAIYPADDDKEFICAASLDGVPVPPREWHVPDIIPAGTVTLLNGDGGTGKSLIALQLAVATALGRQWLGQECKSGTVLFVSAEDDKNELHRRLADVVAAEDITFSDLDKLVFRSLAGKDALLACPEGKTNILNETPLFQVMEHWISRYRPSLVVFDTLADLFGGDENNRAQARQFIGILKGLALKHGTTIPLLAHPSLSGMASGSGSSGSTGWNNSVRSRLYFRRLRSDGEEIDPDARELEVMKANYGPAGIVLKLRWQNGVFVTDTSQGGTLDRMAADAKAERVFLRLLDEYTAQGRFVSASPSSTYAPAAFQGNPNAEGMTKRAFKMAMERLFQRGVITVAEHGSGAKARNHIARKTERQDD
ncbi:bifunctional DNA primase/polymerase [Roseovarius sp. B08]|uniref:bifunctional DNA primase/polymerase n=1 Tax=Roseovarius sp. B08 TaxID=3449223 RepID=UPI003EDC41E6